MQSQQPDELHEMITRDNALALLAATPCPSCSRVGRYVLFKEIQPRLVGTIGIGIRCDDCGKHHPFIKQHVLWLRGA